MNNEEVVSKTNKYFWFERASKAGHCNIIRGQVVHPNLGDNEEETDVDTVTYPSKADGYNCDGTKEVKIGGCNYYLSACQLMLWLKPEWSMWKRTNK